MKIKINDEWLNGEINFENKILTLKYNENETKIPYEKIETLGKENEETNLKYYNDNNELVSLNLILDNEVHNNLVNDYEKDKVVTVAEPAPAVVEEPTVIEEPVAIEEPVVAVEEAAPVAEPVAEPEAVPVAEPVVAVEEAAPVAEPVAAPEPAVVAEPAPAAEPEPVLVDEPILPSEPAAEPTPAPAPAQPSEPAEINKSAIASINVTSSSTSYDEEVQKASESYKKDSQRHIIMTITFIFIVLSALLLYIIKIDGIPTLPIYLVFHINLFIFGAVHLRHD